MMTDTLVERLTNEIVETERLGFDASFYRDIKAEVEAQANQIAELKGWARQLGEAVNYAHSEGFEWPSDPWSGIDSKALEGNNVA
jgi:hypothetical protein